MRQRGRIGRGQLSVISNLEAHARYVQAPSNLPQAERDLFNKVVQSMPSGFFQNSDCPLLESFVQATLSADCYVATLHNDPFNEEVQKLWDRAVRLQIALATKLRLTPHSRIGPIPRHASKPTRRYRPLTTGCAPGSMPSPRKMKPVDRSGVSRRVN